jgi:ABC-type nitrate/sulfonate/bicarbonate transport system ATPase subunit
LNAAATAGAVGRLDVRIAAKAFTGADGARVEVVRDLQLAMPSGCFGALIGPSGCGKTTVLRMIAGLDADFDGAIARPGRGRLAMVFQEPALLPWRTVDENIRLCMEAAGVEGRGLDAMLAMLGLAGHRERFPSELSLGLARRVALARAFIVDPDLLLLDEPFVSLDEATARRLRAELAALHAATRPTTLMVTHDVDEALLLSDRLFVMGGTPASVVHVVDITVPREDRTDDVVAALRRDLAEACSSHG